MLLKGNQTEDPSWPENNQHTHMQVKRTLTSVMKDRALAGDWSALMKSKTRVKATPASSLPVTDMLPSTTSTSPSLVTMQPSQLQTQQKNTVIIISHTGDLNQVICT